MALEDQGSRLARSTAEGAATLRAAGTLIPERELRNPDSLAARMIKPGASMAALVKVPGSRGLVLRLLDRLIPGGVLFELARTRHMDELLLEEVAAGVRQVVILGAGYDSRAYRLEQLRATSVFEVDHPVTAALKQERLAAVVGSLPPNVRYVTVDFNTEDVGERLAEHDFAPAERSVVVWSGVAPYLEPEGVDATLGWMAGQAQGSTILFDYCWQEFIDGEVDDMFGAGNLRRRVAAQGEPFKSGIPRGQSAGWIRERGLELLDDYGLDEARERYLTRADGSTLGPMWEFGGMIRARVP